MNPEDLIFIGLALVAGIGIGVAMMLFIKPQAQAIYPPMANIEKSKYYFVDRPQPQQQVVQQPPAQMTDRVSNEETMIVKRGPGGEFLGYTIHRDVESK